MSKHNEVDYHEEGKKLLARVNLDGLNLEGVGRYDPLNAIYKYVCLLIWSFVCLTFDIGHLT